MLLRGGVESIGRMDEKVDKELQVRYIMEQVCEGVRRDRNQLFGFFRVLYEVELSKKLNLWKNKSN